MTTRGFTEEDKKASRVSTWEEATEELNVEVREWLGAIGPNYTGSYLFPLT